MSLEHAAEATFEAVGGVLTSPAVVTGAAILGIAAVSYVAARNLFRSFS
jgi:hypothetical protein